MRRRLVGVMSFALPAARGLAGGGGAVRGGVGGVGVGPASGGALVFLRGVRSMGVRLPPPSPWMPACA